MELKDLKKNKQAKTTTTTQEHQKGDTLIYCQDQ